ncbi:MAG TPA: acetate--CoA ligase family protein, partial [Micromonosporaceae bacterium]
VRRDRSGGVRRSGAERPVAPDEAAVDALFAQAGVVQTADAGELVDAARMLAGQPLPAGDRLAVIGGGGTLDVLAAEAAEAAGLRVPALSPALRARLAAIAGGPDELDNPVNLGVRASGEALAAVVDEVVTSGEVDSLLVVVAGTRANGPAAALDALGSAVDRHPGFAAAVVVVGVPGPPVLGSRRVPVFDLPEPAVRALSRATRYAEWRRQPLGAPPYLPDIDAAAARAVVDEALSAGDGALAAGAGWQPREQVVRLLNAYRIQVDELPEPDEGAPVRMTAGVIHDPLFGSLVHASTEASGDPVYRLVPMTDRDAARMWRSLDHPAPPSDPDGATATAVQDLLLRLGRLAEDLPEVAELRLDPVLAGPHEATVAGARLRLRRTGVEPDPWLRRLRQPD